MVCTHFGGGGFQVVTKGVGTCPSVCAVAVCACMCASGDVSFGLCVYPSLLSSYCLCPYACLCVCVVFVYRHVQVGVPVCICASVCLCLHLCIFLCVHVSV